MTIKINDIIIDFMLKNKIIIFIWVLLTFILYPIHHVIIPKYYGLVINSFKDKSSKFVNFVTYLSLFYILSMIVESSLYYCTKIISPNFGEFATTALYNYVIDNYELHFDDIKSGEILSKITYIPNLFFSYLKVFKTLLFSQLFVFASTLYHYYFVSMDVFYFFVFAIAVNTLFIYYIFNIKHKKDTQLYYNRSKLFEYINDSMSNLVSVYTTNNEENEKNKFIDEEYKIYKDSIIESMNVYFYSETSWNFICILIFIVLNYLIYISYTNHKINTETLVSTFTLTYSVLRFYETAPHVSDKISTLYSEIGDVDKFFKEINKNNKIHKNNKNTFVNGNIEFINVYHKYKDTFVLDNISFTINKGEKVALIGPIGSGKSTTIKLLLGFQPLLLGTIKINNIDINNIPNNEIRNNIFYIPQKPKLFNRTLYENIIYGVKNPPKSNEILQLLAYLKLHSLIDVFNKKMNKKVGIDGNHLSGGQKQIVWLLRSFYHDSKIIIMDEPTASLDKENKELMIHNIQKLSIGKTLIIITHDNVYDNFRKIYFENGKIGNSWNL